MIRHVAAIVIAMAGAFAGQSKPPATSSVLAIVTDSTGGIIPGASIWASSAPDSKVSCVTTVTGECTIRGLEPGRYLLETNLSGFATERTRVEIAAGETYRWNVKISVLPMRGIEDLVAHVTRLTGADPIDCGRLRPARPSVQVTADQAQPALECARNAAQQRKPFWTSIGRQGIDSIVVDGLLGSTDGVIYRFDYDSAPCGGPGCPSRFTTARCEFPTLVDRNQAVAFACSVKRDRDSFSEK